MINSKEIKCIVFDYANTLSSDLFFQTIPEACQKWRELFQEHIFSKKAYLTYWCTGKLSVYDIANIMQPYVHMPIHLIIAEMHKGCKNLTFNTSVKEFAISQKKAGRKIALVTANIDLFTDTVVPFHGLEKIFDIIINSADYKNDNKLDLWPIAFSRLNDKITYNNSLLIDDSDEWVAKFIANGGNGYRYVDDLEFVNWLVSNGYSIKD